MTQRLYRKRNDKVVAGVAAGLGEYFDVDPVFIRLVFVLLAFIHGLGILAYIVLWILVPARESTYAMNPPVADVSMPPAPVTRKGGGQLMSRVLGIIFIVLGGLFLLDNLVDWLPIDDLWPILLIVLGVVILLGSKKEHGQSGQEVLS